jgi:hypothetical protein
VVRVIEVSMLIAVIVAPGTAAPVESRTLPINSAEATWAWHCEPTSRNTAMKQKAIATRNAVFDLCLLSTGLAS